MFFSKRHNVQCTLLNATCCVNLFIDSCKGYILPTCLLSCKKFLRYSQVRIFNKISISKDCWVWSSNTNAFNYMEGDFYRFEKIKTKQSKNAFDMNFEHFGGVLVIGAKSCWTREHLIQKLKKQAGAELCQAQVQLGYSVRQPSCLPVRSYPWQVVFLSGLLPVMSSFFQVIFLSGPLPVKSGCLVRLSSC